MKVMRITRAASASRWGLVASPHAAALEQPQRGGMGEIGRLKLNALASGIAARAIRRSSP